MDEFFRTQSAEEFIFAPEVRRISLILDCRNPSTEEDIPRLHYIQVGNLLIISHSITAARNRASTRRYAEPMTQLTDGTLGPRYATDMDYTESARSFLDGQRWKTLAPAFGYYVEDQRFVLEICRIY